MWFAIKGRERREFGQDLDFDQEVVHIFREFISTQTQFCGFVLRIFQQETFVGNGQNLMQHPNQLVDFASPSYFQSASQTVF